MLYRHALAIGCLVVACGRIDFDPVPAMLDAPGDGSAGSDAAGCAYLPICMQGQITCCSASGPPFCTLDGPGVCTGGTITRCSIYTQQGCPPGWACCITQQQPEATCYSPQLPQPC